MTAPVPSPLAPTSKQVAYLAKLTGIRARTRLARYVARRVGKASGGDAAAAVTKWDFARAIDAELASRRALR